jgi:hypothetical protein
MPQNFYRGKDADIVAGSANFASLVATGFATYGLTSAQAATFGTTNSALQAAYSTSINPSTRTPVAVEAKVVAVRNMRVNAVLLAKIAYATATVTDVQLVALGLLPRVSRVPRPVPPVPPAVEVVAVLGRVGKVRVHDQATGRRGLPFGAKGANVYSYVGASAPTDPREYHFEGMTTRATVDVLFPNSVASGATVWISACWVSARGQVSIASSPTSFTLQGGAIPAAA